MAAEKPHAATVSACLAAHGVTIERGLTDAQVLASRAKHGSNELDKEEPTAFWKLVLQQFDDMLVKILLGAAMISFVLAFFEDHDGLSAFVEPFVIVLILVINAAVGVWQESNAESALDALKELQSSTATVMRNGALIPALPATELVPGDIVHVRVGDKVPADCRVLALKTTTVRTDEGSLTGESATVQKVTEPVAADARIQAKINMAFAGTTVSNGTFIALVCATGMASEIGKIQKDVQAAAEEEEKTPLTQKLDAFGEMLTKVITAICLLVWLMNYRQFFDPAHGGMLKGCIYYMKIAVALGVAAIPEGLPAVITLCLSLGTRRMVAKNAIVRKLPSVETLGCCTVICSDKTGTLTTNQMTAVALVHPSAEDGTREYAVEGISYRPQGTVVGMERLSSTSRGALALSKVCSLCNEAQIVYNAPSDKYERIGEPTEAALKVLVEKMGLPTVEPPSSAADAAVVCNNAWMRAFKQQALLEFSRDRKSMGVLVTPVAGSDALPTVAGASQPAGTQLLVKGAPESILERCDKQRLPDGTDVPLTPGARARLTATFNEMARRPLRVLAFACKEELGPLADYTADKGASHPMHRALTDPSQFAAIETALTFVGFVGIKDPARAEVRGAIQKCYDAGVRVMMITGDTKDTAEAIAKEIGIFAPGEDIANKSFTGAAFFALPLEQRRALLMRGGGSRVFSRTEPRDKQELVRMLRNEGEVPAMTGDGVNDAPALKQAAIGIAMGISGTEVAKEAADMILADDNFATIVAAIEEGRAIYSNMKAFIRYLISSNIGEVASIFITVGGGVGGMGGGTGGWGHSLRRLARRSRPALPSGC
jgi:Ca2+-transporting ATPase